MVKESNSIEKEVIMKDLGAMGKDMDMAHSNFSMVACMLENGRMTKLMEMEH